MDLVKFIFSSFWIWLGAFLMLAIVVEGIVNIVKAIMQKKEDADA
jgi:hypothetical protein